MDHADSSLAGSTQPLHGSVAGTDAGPGENYAMNAHPTSTAILWEMWERFSPFLDELVSRSDRERASKIVATLFANFLLDNIDLVRPLEDSFKDIEHVPFDPILRELERRAQHFPGSECAESVGAPFCSTVGITSELARTQQQQNSKGQS